MNDLQMGTQSNFPKSPLKITNSILSPLNMQFYLWHQGTQAWHILWVTALIEGPALNP